MAPKSQKEKGANGTSTLPFDVATLTRYETTEEGTFGRFNYRNFNCFSLERPWLDNRPSLSSIPPGRYLCRWTYSPRFKRPTYEVLKVPGRCAIRIHSANLTSQLNGCISLGLKLGTIEGKKAVLLSKPAIRKLEELANEKDFILEIK